VAARFAEIHAAYGPALERLSRGYERTPEARRDLVQEILAAIWRALPGFEERASVRTWVYRIAHNVAATHCLRARRAGTSRWVSIEDAAEVPSAHDEEASANNRESLERVAELIRSLAPLDRQLVLLFLEGLDPGEIAEITGLTTTNVTTKVSRIRAALRARLGRSER
jgi:RNA polymerase sigma-70 factor (ECF subfamily)